MCDDPPIASIVTSNNPTVPQVDDRQATICSILNYQAVVTKRTGRINIPELTRPLAASSGSQQDPASGIEQPHPVAVEHDQSMVWQLDRIQHPVSGIEFVIGIGLEATDTEDNLQTVDRHNGRSGRPLAARFDIDRSQYRRVDSLLGRAAIAADN